jgi:transcriptional regulator with XRE-family HTH domain
MSMMFYDHDDLPARRLVLGQLFGHCIKKTRQAAGRSVGESACLAGMEPSQWAAVEAGYVPAGDLLRPMADALGVGFDKIGVLVLLCRDAWEA